MSQNRTQSEKENIIIHLNQSDQLNDKDLACELKNYSKAKSQPI